MMYTNQQIDVDTSAYSSFESVKVNELYYRAPINEDSRSIRIARSSIMLEVIFPLVCVTVFVALVIFSIGGAELASQLKNADKEAIYFLIGFAVIFLFAILYRPLITIVCKPTIASGKVIGTYDKKIKSGRGIKTIYYAVLVQDSVKKIAKKVKITHKQFKQLEKDDSVRLVKFAKVYYVVPD
ncbi:MAG: hypothetical protein MJ093_03675 [Saccharofermentans sp.]|nr:hypothetical protein [Saccharofermentans sp.]